MNVSFMVQLSMVQYTLFPMFTEHSDNMAERLAEFYYREYFLVNMTVFSN